MLTPKQCAVPCGQDNGGGGGGGGGRRGGVIGGEVVW